MWQYLYRSRNGKFTVGPEATLAQINCFMNCPVHGYRLAFSIYERIHLKKRSIVLLNVCGTLDGVLYWISLWRAFVGNEVHTGFLRFYSSRCRVRGHCDHERLNENEANRVAFVVNVRVIYAHLIVIGWCSSANREIRLKGLWGDVILFAHKGCLVPELPGSSVI